MDRMKGQEMERAAVIFDLDGTLWDSTEAVVKVWNDIFEREGFSIRMTPEYLHTLMGKTTDEIRTILFPDLPKEEQKKWMDTCSREEVAYLWKHGAVLYDDLEETLHTLSQRYLLMVVSNCQLNYARAFIESHKLEHFFTDYEEWERTRKTKAENIRMTMERNHVSRAVYVGDTISDEEAARLAGLPFIYASYGFGDSEAPDAEIHSLKELPACVDSFLKTNI